MLRIPFKYYIIALCSTAFVVFLSVIIHAYLSHAPAGYIDAALSSSSSPPSSGLSVEANKPSETTEISKTYQENSQADKTNIAVIQAESEQAIRAAEAVLQQYDLKLIATPDTKQTELSNQLQHLKTRLAEIKAGESSNHNP